MAGRTQEMMGVGVLWLLGESSEDSSQLWKERSKRAQSRGSELWKALHPQGGHPACSNKSQVSHWLPRCPRSSESDQREEPPFKCAARTGLLPAQGLSSVRAPASSFALGAFPAAPTAPPLPALSPSTRVLCGPLPSPQPCNPPAPALKCFLPNNVKPQDQTSK